MIHPPPIEDTAIDLTMTHHINYITDHPHIEVLQLTNPEINVDHTHGYPTDLQGKTRTDQVHIPAGYKENHIKENPSVKIKDPHMYYYNSDDHSSD